eukprot:241724_1
MKTSLVATVFDSMVFLMLIFGMNSVAVYALACNWTQGNSVLPTTDYGFAVGSYNDSIFILGGFDSPSMILARNQHACIAHSNYLWSFAGRGSAGFTKNNERISTTDITQNTWAAVEPFPNTVDGIRAVIGADGIYLIGGLSDGSNYWDTVYIMDFDGTAMTLSSNRLVYPIQYAGIILVHDIIYVFGGRNPSAIDTWMHCNLFITGAPTEQPFNLPSANPSLSPTNDTSSTTTPTRNPTQSPVSPQTSSTSIAPTDPPSHTPHPAVSPEKGSYTLTTLSIATTYTSSLSIWTTQMRMSADPDDNTPRIVIITVMSCCTAVLTVYLVRRYCVGRKQRVINSMKAHDEDNAARNAQPGDQNASNIVYNNDSDSHHENEGVTSGGHGNIGQN